MFHRLMELVHVLGGLLSLATTVMVLIAGLMAVRHIGGVGPVMMLLGSIGSLLASLFWVGSSIGVRFGFSIYDRIDSDKIGQLISAISSFSTLCWMTTGVGVFFLVLRMVAMMKRGEVLKEIRAEHG